MSLLFYLERMVNLDMAFQTFLMLKSGSLEIQSGRFGAAATQVWAWAAQSLGLPLKAVLATYSFGHAVWPAMLALFCWRIGEWRWAVAVLLTAIVATAHTFFWLSEMPQGLPFLCALFAWMHSKGSLRAFRWWQWPLWAAALVTAFYFHPMVLYAAVFLCLFFGLEQGRTSAWRWMHGAVLAVFALLVYLKYNIFKLDWYDAAALKRQAAFAQLWPNWLDIESNRLYLRWVADDYWLLWGLLAACTFFYIWQKKWLKAALMACWPPAYVLLVNVPFHEGQGQQFYMENLYLPLAVFAAVPLVFDVWKHAEQSQRAQWANVALAMVVLISLGRIWQSHRPWREKIAWEQVFLQKTASLPQRKWLLSEEQVPMQTLKMSWGTPYEFLLLSALQHPDSARCALVSTAPQQYDTLLQQPRLFLGTFQNYPLENLPKRYFNVRDSSGYARYQAR